MSTLWPPGGQPESMEHRGSTAVSGSGSTAMRKGRRIAPRKPRLALGGFHLLGLSSSRFGFLQFLYISALLLSFQVVIPTTITPTNLPQFLLQLSFIESPFTNVVHAEMQPLQLEGIHVEVDSRGGILQVHTGVKQMKSELSGESNGDNTEHLNGDLHGSNYLNEHIQQHEVHPREYSADNESDDAGSNMQLLRTKSQTDTHDSESSANRNLAPNAPTLRDEQAVQQEAFGEVSAADTVARLGAEHSSQHDLQALSSSDTQVACDSAAVDEKLLPLGWKLNATWFDAPLRPGDHAVDLKSSVVPANVTFTAVHPIWELKAKCVNNTVTLIPDPFPPNQKATGTNAFKMADIEVLKTAALGQDTALSPAFIKLTNAASSMRDAADRSFTATPTSDKAYEEISKAAFDALRDIAISATTATTAANAAVDSLRNVALSFGKSDNAPNDGFNWLLNHDQEKGWHKRNNVQQYIRTFPGWPTRGGVPERVSDALGGIALNAADNSVSQSAFRVLNETALAVFNLAALPTVNATKLLNDTRGVDPDTLWFLTTYSNALLPMGEFVIRSLGTIARSGNAAQSGRTDKAVELLHELAKGPGSVTALAEITKTVRASGSGATPAAVTKAVNALKAMALDQNRNPGGAFATWGLFHERSVEWELERLKDNRGSAPQAYINSQGQAEATAAYRIVKDGWYTQRQTYTTATTWRSFLNSYRALPFFSDLETWQKEQLVFKGMDAEVRRRQYWQQGQFVSSRMAQTVTKALQEIALQEIIAGDANIALTGVNQANFRSTSDFTGGDLNGATPKFLRGIISQFHYAANWCQGWVDQQALCGRDILARLLDQRSRAANATTPTAPTDDQIVTNLKEIEALVDQQNDAIWEAQVEYPGTTKTTERSRRPAHRAETRNRRNIIAKSAPSVGLAYVNEKGNAVWRVGNLLNTRCRADWRSFWEPCTHASCTRDGLPTSYYCGSTRPGFREYEIAVPPFSWRSAPSSMRFLDAPGNVQWKRETDAARNALVDVLTPFKNQTCGREYFERGGGNLTGWSTSGDNLTPEAWRTKHRCRSDQEIISAIKEAEARAGEAVTGITIGSYDNLNIEVALKSKANDTCSSDTWYTGYVKAVRQKLPKAWNTGYCESLLLGMYISQALEKLTATGGPEKYSGSINYDSLVSLALNLKSGARPGGSWRTFGWTSLAVLGSAVFPIAIAIVSTLSMTLQY